MDETFQQLSNSRNDRLSLLGLPSEIRDFVYELALISDKPTVTFCLDYYDDYEEATQPSLTRVNRQVRQESLPIFYAAKNFILHTEEPRATDTRRWLACNEAKLPRLLGVSLWLRYVGLTNDPQESNGAICISLKRSKRTNEWRVSEDWEWVTVTRKPGALQSDAKFLIGTLRRILVEEPDCLSTAAGFVSMMADTKMLYKKEKMS